MSIWKDILNSFIDDTRMKLRIVVSEDKVVFKLMNARNETLSGASIFCNGKLLGKTSSSGKLEVDRMSLPKTAKLDVEFGIYSSSFDFLNIK